jgi:hypothetical protein
VRGGGKNRATKSFSAMASIFNGTDPSSSLKSGVGSGKESPSASESSLSSYPYWTNCREKLALLLKWLLANLEELHSVGVCPQERHRMAFRLGVSTRSHAECPQFVQSELLFVVIMPLLMVKMMSKKIGK